MSEHTKEQWKVVDRGDEYGMDIDAFKEGFGDVTLALDVGMANTRRIVACVNACSGIPTHGLEGMSVALTLSEMADVQQQRDELLLAMKVLRANIDDEYYKLYIDGVLTKVKPT